LKEKLMKRILFICVLVLISSLVITQPALAEWYGGNMRTGAYGVSAQIATPNSAPYSRGGGTSSWVSTPGGDGTYIVTVLDTSGNTTGQFFVGLPGKNRYPSAFVAADPDNYTVLLKMEDKVFPAADIPVDRFSPWGDTLVLHCWEVQNYQELKRANTVWPVDGGGGMVKIETGPYIDVPGALVTDKLGNIVGLLGTYKPLAPGQIRLGGVGSTGPLVTIQDALSILSRFTDK
jgi:hypothetical protein